MHSSEANPIESMRLIAARHSLGLAHSWEIPPIADQALCKGLYSDALAELATVAKPTLAVVSPLLGRALLELGLTTPSRTEAAWYLADHCVRRIASEEEPLSALSLLKDVSSAAEDVLPAQSHVGDGLDLGSLLGIFWSYSAPNENYYEAEKRVIADEAERKTLLDRLAREESHRWLARRAESGERMDGDAV